MYYKIIRNDISKSKGITLITLLFVTAAAMLVSLAAVLLIHLSGAIDTLMSQAKTPHFMQMHSGDIDTSRLSAFAEGNSNVEEFQVLEFLNVDTSMIIIDGKALTGSVQDNGFMVQSKSFDFLLDLEGKVIKVSDGEVYVPISYLKDRTAEIGSNMKIGNENFIIAGFLRDSQMNSLLASSKRFLISENDYHKIKEAGSVEYLIEFRLKDRSRLSTFQNAYTSAGLEANGPTITYPLIKMLNGISDGIMIAVILLVSVLVVAIAFMCIRFTLLAKIEEDYREIGVMKAIGLPVTDIKKIFLVKYAAVAAAGCLLGSVLSFGFRGLLLENIKLYMGESNNTSLALVFGLIGVMLVYVIILLYVNKVLKQFKRISAAQAIRYGTSTDKTSVSKNFFLSKNKLLSTNVFLGIKDVLSRKKLYATMLAVLMLAVFIIIVPQNLFHTISSDRFIGYMGIGSYDMRIDLQQTEDISEKVQKIKNTMESDSTITRYTVLVTKNFKLKSSDGTLENIKIELGDHSIFPIEYSHGRAPQSKDEIALSVLKAEELGKKTGDIITLVSDGKEIKRKVSGIYSDITNGGKTAKAVFTDESEDIMWYIISAGFIDKSFTKSKVAEYGGEFSYAKVTGVDEFISQTFGMTINAVGKASYAATVIAILIILLITLLFMKMLVAKDRYSIAMMKAFGYTNADIRQQYITRSVFLLFIGIVLGTLLANTLGERLAGAGISTFGVSSFEFALNPFSAYLLNPLMMAATVILATLLGVTKAGEIIISEHIKE
ncbi:ABC transporter permease [Anaerocolumna sp. AGMB13020]|uniref:ABC transporter permease n=1 Tax=Anaerocolumna sp. AGMB13020 TaxID=3081750 RepID=UPI002955894C|nr:ABC transporter permease [Anaerocolumna sp. AGMB13020]WOO37815.1 ABC transporter permease [Anaerocolumna sp. AGMB13020]